LSLGDDLLVPLCEVVLLCDIDTNERGALNLRQCECPNSILLLPRVSDLLLLLLGLLGSFLGVAILLALLDLGDLEVLHLAIGGSGFGHD
jgi:hypothetical protein